MTVVRLLPVATDGSNLIFFSIQHFLLSSSPNSCNKENETNGKIDLTVPGPVCWHVVGRPSATRPSGYGHLLSVDELQEVVNCDAVVRFQHVCVKSSKEDTATEVYVSVKNLAFGKDVSVRLSVNEWETYRDVKARWISSPSPDVDVFCASFHLPVSERWAEFAIWCSVAEATYWDNNCSRNYAISVVQ
eukprot:m.62064 g.62064  ORF g.62064 m.62064 type:complete len:189 (+) comp35036_c0_seq2:348-914(+)